MLVLWQPGAFIYYTIAAWQASSENSTSASLIYHMMDQRSKRNKPTSAKFAVEQNKAELKLPILHIDSIWPPHMRKKRALRSFKDIVNRKKIMVKFLSVNPPPSPKPEKFNVKDLETVLTINERIKIIKEKQNLTLETIKAKAKENAERKVERQVESIHGVIRITSNQVHSGIPGKIDNKDKEKDPWYLRLSNTDKTLNANKYSLHKRKSQCAFQRNRRHPTCLPTQRLPKRLPKLEKRTNYLQTVVNQEKDQNQYHGQAKKVKGQEHVAGKVKEHEDYKKKRAQNDGLDILTSEGNESIAVSVKDRGRNSTEEINPKHFKGKAQFEPSQFGNNSKKGKHGNDELPSFRPLADPRFIKLQQALVNPSESKTLKREVRRTSRNSWMTPLQSIKWVKHWERGPLR